MGQGSQQRGYPVQTKDWKPGYARTKWLAQVTEEVCEEAENVTQACWVSGPSPAPKRESCPETAQKPGGFSSQHTLRLWNFVSFGWLLQFPKNCHHIFWKLGSYPFGKTYWTPRRGRQICWGLITAGQCTTGQVHLTMDWNHWFTAPLHISGKCVPSLGNLCPLQHESVTFLLLMKSLSVCLSLTMLATPTLQKWAEIPHWDLMI